MTQKEKARAYDEALERAKEIKEKIVYSHLSTESCKAVSEYIDTIIPELAESEDEWMLQTIIRGFENWKSNGKETFNFANVDDILAYLEKQKELDKMIVVSPEVWDKAIADAYENGKKDGEKQKENPKSADSIPSDCTSDAKCEDRDSKYGVFPEDVIVVARACEKLETHGYPELAHALKNVNLYTKEQKPEHLELKAGHWYICHRAFCCRADLLTVKEGERFQCEKDGIVKGFVIKEPEKYFKECSAPALMEDEQKEQKPAEWSEEDEDMLNRCISSIEEARDYRYYYKETDGDTSYDEEVAWLKSLRPSWKPTEEQMETLERASTNKYLSAKQFDILVSLYEQLKQL